MTTGERVVLLAAEGMAELDGVDWLRDASEEERTAFRQHHHLSEDEYRGIIIDRTGRPYWLVTLLENAPEIAKRKAATYARVRSLIE